MYILMLGQVDLKHELGAHAKVAELTFSCDGSDAGRASCFLTPQRS